MSVPVPLARTPALPAPGLWLRLIQPSSSVSSSLWVPLINKDEYLASAERCRGISVLRDNPLHFSHRDKAVTAVDKDVRAVRNSRSGLRCAYHGRDPE